MNMDMQAIILAAGIGKRLGTLAGGLPKCLLQFGGETLLARHLRLLQENGITDVTIVTGYEQARIAEELATLSRAAALSRNPDFEQGSVVSLSVVCEQLRSGTEILLMDADVLYHPDILRRLIRAPRSDLLLLDREFEPGEEPVKICVSDDRLVEFRKQPDAGQYDVIGESVGFFRFSAATAELLATQTERYIRDGRREAPYEEAIRDLLLAYPDRFSYEDITGLAWIEIDFADDIDKARTQILPALGVNVFVADGDDCHESDATG